MLQPVQGQSSPSLVLYIHVSTIIPQPLQIVIPTQLERNDPRTGFKVTDR